MTDAAVDAFLPVRPRRRHLERSVGSLALNTLATGGLGTLFWLLAARLYSKAEVGNALTAASLLLAAAYLAQLNMGASLSRYLPRLGGAARAAAIFAYRVAITGGMIVGLGVLAIGALRGGGVIQGGTWPLTIAIAIAVPLWVVFALQDIILVAVRRAPVVPVENAAVSIAKFALLPAVVLFSDRGTALLAAWILPIVIAIPAINIPLFSQWLGRPERRLERRLQSRPEFVSFALRDFGGQASTLLAMRLVPVAIDEFGRRNDTALIGLPWTILTVASLALPALSLAMIAELSHGDEDAAALRRRAAGMVARIVTPACVLAALLARPMLSVAGSAYASRGAVVLAWGALGLVPAAFAEIRFSEMRANGLVIRATVLQMMRAAVIIVAAILLTQRDHIRAIGFAYFAVNAVTAALLFAPTRRRSVSAVATTGAHA